jgi:hypothetical protein
MINDETKDPFFLSFLSLLLLGTCPVVRINSSSKKKKKNRKLKNWVWMGEEMGGWGAVLAARAYLEGLGLSRRRAPAGRMEREGRGAQKEEEEE